MLLVSFGSANSPQQSKSNATNHLILEQLKVLAYVLGIFGLQLLVHVNFAPTTQRLADAKILPVHATRYLLADVARVNKSGHADGDHGWNQTTATAKGLGHDDLAFAHAIEATGTEPSNE